VLDTIFKCSPTSLSIQGEKIINEVFSFSHIYNATIITNYKIAMVHNGDKLSDALPKAEK
jgi:hypothetical protein